MEVSVDDSGVPRGRPRSRERARAVGRRSSGRLFAKLGGPLLHADHGRLGSERGEGGAAGRRPGASLGSAVRRRAEPPVPGGQPEQAERGARPEDRCRARSGPGVGSGGGRGGAGAALRRRGPTGDRVRIGAARQPCGRLRVGNVSRLGRPVEGRARLRPAVASSVGVDVGDRRAGRQARSRGRVGGGPGNGHVDCAGRPGRLDGAGAHRPGPPRGSVAAGHVAGVDVVPPDQLPGHGNRAAAHGEPASP